MSDRLFAKDKSNKRKRSQPSVARPNTKGRSRVSGPSGSNSLPLAKKRRKDETHESDDGEKDELVGAFDDVDLDGPTRDYEPGSGDEYDDETPADKRLRLAKLYLTNVKRSIGKDMAADMNGEEVAGWDAAEVDREIIESRLQRDVLEHSGKVHSFVGDEVGSNIASSSSAKFTGHRLPVTAATASEDGKLLFTGSKDGAIIKWDILTRKRLMTMVKIRPSGPTVKGKERAVDGHSDEVLALALSSDRKYLASGGRDKRIVIWDPETGTFIKSFGGHKDMISSLAFRKSSHQLFTASYDRTVKIFDLSPQVMGYIETLFGHQDVINSIDSLRSETAISSGARDRTVRFWKVVEENQLVFRGGGRSALRDVLEGVPVDDAEAGKEEERDKFRERNSNPYLEGSIECVTMLDESTFLSGGDSGAIRLWSTSKKKAVYTHGLAHGLQETHSESEGVVKSPRWVTAIAALRYSDVFVSGSWDGFIRVWKLDDRNRAFSPIGTLKAPGFVNSLQMIAPQVGWTDQASWIARQVQKKVVNAEAAPVEDASDDHQPPGPIKKHQHCLIVAGLGQEPRLGRWMRIAGDGSGSRNTTLVVAIPFSSGGMPSKRREMQ